MKNKFLITSAFSPELNPLKRLFKNRKDIFFSTTGIGLTSAAVKTTENILKIKPQSVIFIGSSGCYNQNIPLLSVLSADKCKIADYVFASNKSYNPKNFMSEFFADKKIISKLKLQKEFKIYFSSMHTSLSITNDRKIAGMFAEKGNYFENLELYGVAQACDNLGIPWNAISVVTNYIGKNAHQQWLENYKEAAKITTSIISSLFKI